MAEQSDSRGQIRIVSLENAAAQQLDLRNWRNLQNVNWSSDGNQLYVTGWFASSNAILSVDLAGNMKVLLEVPAGQAWLTTPVPSPDGHYLAYTKRSFEQNVSLLENF